MKLFCTLIVAFQIINMYLLRLTKLDTQNPEPGVSVGISNLSRSRNSLHNRKKPYFKNRIDRIYGCSLNNRIVGTVEMAQELRTLLLQRTWIWFLSAHMTADKSLYLQFNRIHHPGALQTCSTQNMQAKHPYTHTKK